MQLKPEALAGHLAKGLKAFYTVHGDEALLAQEAADAVRAAARQAGFSERHVFTVSGAYFDWAPVLAAAQAMSLFAERQLIEIRIPGGKPGKEGSEALQRYCEAAPQDVLTLVTLPRLDKTQLGSAWFSALDGAGISVRVDPVERRELPTWIARRLAQQGQPVAGGPDGQRALEFFADRVEGNLLAAHQELQKLALLHPPGELSLTQIEEAVLDVARFDVFKLSEAVLSGQAGRVMRMLDGLQAEGEAAVLVHWTLAEDIRALKRARDAMAAGKPLPIALREARVWGPKERLFERVLPALAEPQLLELLHAAQVCDGIVKGLRHPEWPANPWDALNRLALMLMQALRR
ncbi:DNA polymerase III subunit delta [Pelomonas sp. CA6]|uniref:DNA polymerase III subunit delta n=1 Tax=Pelomonas sp. CA6 TaxID=2907999 RepID=UPI001F4C2355|nr:DNA polymerase III subunit delta [Pelomonas sp. CA6]MCH7343482.1 DNA polymerase III subunit delta [Pelomonas sp. CA6]